LKILLLLGFFDTFLFPGNILQEKEFNPAQLHREKVEVMLTSELRYELPDLRAFGVHSQIKRYSIKAVSFGGDLYRENFLELGAGFPVAPGFAVGFNVAGMNCWIKDSKNEFTYSIKIGGLFDTGPFSISGWVNNINVPRISAIDYTPASYSLCFDYRAQANLHFNLSVRGVAKEIPFYNFKVVFIPHKIMLLGLGINTRPILLEYGMKISLGRMFLCYSGNRHQQLGLTHNFGFGFVQ
jgi:hypothetical protein